MFDVKTVEREVGGRTFQFESGRMARLAHGSVVVRYGDTMVLVAASQGPAREGIDFFPLTMDYREKTSAAGKIPGGFFKREGRPTTKEILTMRMMDRPIRPLFPEGFRQEVQIQAFVLSFDQANEPDICAINGASASLTVSDIPFLGPVGAVRVGLLDGELVLNPTVKQRDDSRLDLVVVGTADAVTMVEAGAKEVSEEDMIRAIEFGHTAVREICTMQNELRELAGVPKVEFERPVKDEGIEEALRSRFGEEMRAALTAEGKLAKSLALSTLKEKVIEELVPGDEKDPARVKLVRNAFGDLEKATIRAMVLEGRRIDGRSTTDIRPISCEVGLLPCAHGSALFTRGETQALVTTTLGTTRDEQVIDGLEEEFRKKFLLHYNFPPFCVREVRPIRGPGRREIGHGALAERAISAVMPEHDDFPYTIRVVSDVLESNGSSSMATVCGATLSLMDAGIRIRRPVAGIAMGLVVEGEEYRILTDILGAEDHCGDMDFKVAGTQNGITALQMDIKVGGVSYDMMAEALDQARIGRISILRTMLQALSRPRSEISPNAPKMHKLTIPREKIGLLIGPGGKNIRRIQEETGSTLDVADDGTVMIFAANTEGAEAARREVELLSREAKVGEVYKGKVVSIKDFGCFLELWPGTEALCHISELSDGYLDRVDEAVKLGDELEVKVIAIDDSGKVKVSRRALLPGGDAPRPGNSGGSRRGGSGGSRGGRRNDRRGGSRGGSRGGGRNRSR